ncbi:MAG: leucine-rich repeat domain-containing protein [Bacteroidaceae bacterium]|nr:leucine-rich repeat domain-containing protein [Bacteroidaceae bacterium]
MRHHFSTVLIKTYWYTASCKYGDCSKLSSVSIPNLVTSVGQSAFKGCSGLTQIRIGKVQTIGNSAFEGCSGLTNLEIPNFVISIRAGAFKGCTGLTSINLGTSLKDIGEDAFKDCEKKKRDC